MASVTLRPRMRQDFPRKPTKAGRQHDYERSMRHAAIRSRMGSSQNARIYQTQQATFVNPVDTSSPGSAPADLQSFKIKSKQNDYVVCRTWDEDTETEGETDIQVAKDAKLRGGDTRNITVSGVAATEEITPAYTVG